MNQHLLNPFAQDYPDSVDAAIETTAQRCRFNKTRGTWAGHLIASGCSDGLVEVVDLDTKDVIRNFDGHVRGVESLSWSRNGRYLLSASKDWKCVVWDLFFTEQNMPVLPNKPSSPNPTPSLKRQRTRSTSEANSIVPTETLAMQSRGYPTSPMRDSVLFDTPLINAEFHPETSKIILATTSTHEVAMVYLSSPHTSTVDPQSIPNSNASLSGKSHRRKIYWLRDQTRDEAKATLVPDKTEETQDAASDTKMEGAPPDQVVPPPANGASSTLTECEMEERLREAPRDAAPAPHLFTFATFHPSGEWIYVGTSQGILLIFDARTRWLVHREKISTTALKQIAFDRSGRYIVINSTDRAVRVMFVEHQESPAVIIAPSSATDFTSDFTSNLSRATVSIVPLHRFQDQVSRTPWNAVGFSGDAEYVMGGAATKVSHNIYLWDRPTGALVKVLEGPKDSLDDCDWHPTKPIIASVTSAGTINIWQTAVIDNWSAFAPGFEELEENREYEEKEDEFDIEDEDELSRRKRAEEEQDIETLHPANKMLSGMTRKSLGNGNPGIPSISNPTGTKNSSPNFWQLNWPDDDDDVDFFPHLDLESEAIVAAAEEEDVTRP
ncbi:hypothetical protein QFC21_004636 [Naganishia friedmannii]|uniref:Uncharacterized protein n=1 Tax=Naganishia friedmannii TaxID=89922 RepID=A0ACC2VF70_9TREE|nr:hypothetical protein QFC21_004636 [Naganishia friedmannii]